MRLSPAQRESIRKAAQEVFGPEAGVWLFGSRVDDHKRGGDIDFLIQPAQSLTQTLRSKLRLLSLLEGALGERKIDLIIASPGDERPIVRIARETGVRL